MGVWSSYVCTTPPGLALDVRRLPDHVVRGLKLSLRQVPEETKTVDDLLSNLSDAAQISGYLEADNDKGVAWRGLLRALADQNEGAATIRIHMYCQDYENAYWLQLVDGKLVVYHGTHQDCHYHTSRWEEEESYFYADFDEARYVSIVGDARKLEALRYSFDPVEVMPRARRLTEAGVVAGLAGLGR